MHSYTTQDLKVPKDILDHWMDLCHIDASDLNQNLPTLPDDREQDVIYNDSLRSMLEFSINEEDHKEKMAGLERVIRAVFEDSDSQYYQGFHDICAIAYLALGEKASVTLLRFLIDQNLLPGVQPDGLNTALHSLEMVMPLLAVVDPEVHDALRKADIMLIFALSWVLTWFIHDTDDCQACYKLLDTLMTRRDVNFTVYLCTAYLSLCHDKLLSCKGDPNKLYASLTRDQQRLYCQEGGSGIHVDDLIAKATDLSSKYEWGMVLKLREVYGFPIAGITLEKSRPQQPKADTETETSNSFLKSGKNILDSVGRFLDEKTAPIRRQAREHPFLAAGAVAVGFAGIAAFAAVALNSQNPDEPPKEPPPDQ